LSAVRESLLQKKADGKVRCLVCERRCLLVEGGMGWCRTRVNRKGALFTTTYGMVSSLSANPIEKKPLYHFYPGSQALTAGSWGCNFGCPWCQNWEISKEQPSARRHLYNDTYCPQCGAALIERLGYSIIRYDLDEGACPHCGCTIVGRC
jgi:pyruvate formate lyase activating enzyme